MSSHEGESNFRRDFYLIESTLQVASLSSENHSTGVLLSGLLGKELIYIWILTNYVFTWFIFLGFKYFDIKKKTLKNVVL